MSDFLSYTLWRQREERMPRELEIQRATRERLAEQEHAQDCHQVQGSPAEPSLVLCQGKAPSRPRRVWRNVLVNR